MENREKHTHEKKHEHRKFHKRKHGVDGNTSELLNADGMDEGFDGILSSDMEKESFDSNSDIQFNTDGDDESNFVKPRPKS